MRRELNGLTWSKSKSISTPLMLLIFSSKRVCLYGRLTSHAGLSLCVAWSALVWVSGGRMAYDAETGSHQRRPCSEEPPITADGRWSLAWEARGVVVAME